MNGSAIHVCKLKVVEISRFLRFTHPLFWKEISVDTVIDTVEAIKIRELPTKVTNQLVPSGHAQLRDCRWAGRTLADGQLATSGRLIGRR
jgi:hypothetical protein